MPGFHLPYSRIVLTGFMGAGKTTVGERLAHRLNWRFLDLDAEIVRAEGKSIAAIFETQGEAHFRAAERSAFHAALRLKNTVLALGGGALESGPIRESLQAGEMLAVVYLEAPLEVLVQRCEEQQRLRPDAPRRPVLEKHAELAARFLRRQPLYESVGFAVPTSGRSIDDVTQEIVDRLRAASVDGPAPAMAKPR